MVLQPRFPKKEGFGIVLCISGITYATILLLDSFAEDLSSLLELLGRCCTSNSQWVLVSKCSGGRDGILDRFSLWEKMLCISKKCMMEEDINVPLKDSIIR